MHHTRLAASVLNMKLSSRAAMVFRNAERDRRHHGGRRWLRRMANRLERHHARRAVADYRDLVLEAEFAEMDACQTLDLYEEHEYV